MWNSIVSFFKSFLTTFLKSGLKKELELILPIAQNIVQTIENDPSIVVSGTKRQVAFDAISGKLLESQKDMPSYLINLAIEICVAEIKALSGK